MDTTPLARVQDDGVAAPLEQKVDLTDNAELPPLSPTQFHCQQPQQLPHACTSSPGSRTETDGSGTRANASSQTNPDTVQESMSEVMTQLARTRDLLAATEVGDVTMVLRHLSSSFIVLLLCVNTGRSKALSGPS